MEIYRSCSPMVKPSIYPRGAIISNLPVVQFPFSFAYVTRRRYVTMFLSQILSREEKVRSPLHFQNWIELARFCNGINTGFNRTLTSFFPPNKPQILAKTWSPGAGPAKPVSMHPFRRDNLEAMATRPIAPCWSRLERETAARGI